MADTRTEHETGMGPHVGGKFRLPRMTLGRIARLGKRMHEIKDNGKNGCPAALEGRYLGRSRLRHWCRRCLQCS
jgi:hypothetical protein